MESVYFESSGKLLSIDIATLILSRVELGDLLERAKLVSSDEATDQKIRLNYRGLRFKSKLVMSGHSGVTVCGSDQITRKVLTVDGAQYTVCTTATTLMDCVDGDVENISLAHEIKYTLKEYPEWMLSIAATKVMNNPQEFTTRLTEYKSNLLRDYTLFAQEVDETAYDAVVVSLQFVGTSITKQELTQIIRTAISTIMANYASKQYQQALFLVAKEIYRDPIIVNRFRQKSGFKKLLPSAVELSRSIYFKQVLPVIDTFYITDKIDGIRTLLQITEYSQRKKAVGVEVLAISSSVQHIKTFDRSPKGLQASKTILDVEMIEHMEECKQSSIQDEIWRVWQSQGSARAI